MKKKNYRFQHPHNVINSVLNGRVKKNNNRQNTQKENLRKRIFKFEQKKNKSKFKKTETNWEY